MKKILLFWVLILVASCSTDIGYIQDKDHFGLLNRFENTEKYLKYTDKNEIQEFLSREMHISGGRDTSAIDLQDVDTSRILLTTFSEEYKTYTLLINSNTPNKIYNLVFKEEKGVIYFPVIIEYTTTTEFALSYNAGIKNFSEFDGTIAQHNYSTFFDLSREGDIDCDCWNIYRSLPYSGGVIGGGGSYNEYPPSDNGFNNGPTGTGGGPTGTGGGSSGTGGGSSGTGGGSSGTGGGSSGSGNAGFPCSNSPFCGLGWFPVYIPGCGFVCFPFLGGGGGGNELVLLDYFNSNKIESNREEEDCINMLKGFGLILKPDNKIFTNNEATLNPFTQQLNNCLLRNDITDKINELKENVIINPCNGNEISINVEQIASDICFGCGDIELTPENLESAYFDALESNDYIIIAGSFKKCSKFLCIYNILKNSENALWCNTFDNYISDEKHHIIIRADNKDKDGVYLTQDGYTTYNYNFATITININRCDDHYLDIAGTILHEAIHARLYLNAKQIDPDVTDNDYWRIFLSDPQLADVSHEEMAKNYITKLANALREFDGKRYSIDYYLYIAWSGVSRAGFKLGLIDEYISNYYDEYLYIKNQPQTINCN